MQKWLHAFIVYSPTSCADIEAVEKFYNILETSVNTLSAAVLLFIMGDFNAMLQSEGSVLYSPNISENRNSSFLLDFIQTHNLNVVNTLFKKKSLVDLCLIVM